ncbi:MAG TPA: hypothetical protein VFA26_23995 [Gemmataceae bacterium]|nr:hypothetical protein [Gemmataceae bacterium]
MLLSIHIPKCGGTSFRRVLGRLFGPRLALDYASPFADSPPAAVPADTSCIHGHFRAGKYAALFPGARLVTWVRHPVSRVASHYAYFRRHPELGAANPVCRAVHERGLSLVDFARLDSMCDRMSWFLQGRRVEDFAFIGIVEEYEQSLARFGAWLGADPGPAPRENASPDAAGGWRVGPAEAAAILDLNRADVRWYAAARAAAAAAPEPQRRAV